MSHHRLHRGRNLFLAAARGEPERVSKTEYVVLADAIENAIEELSANQTTFKEMELAVRTANAAVTAALDALALAKQSATDTQAAVDAAVKSALDKAKVDGLLSDDVTSRLNADVPPPAEPVTPDAPAA